MTAKRLAFLSLSLNLFLAAAKYTLSRSTGSTAVLAEAAHSLTDVVGSLLVVAGIFLAEMKSRRFPWGLYKVENLAAVLSAGLLFLSSWEIAVMIYRPSPAGLKNLDGALIALVAMAAPVFLFSRYEARRAAVINSPSLTADAAHWRTDLGPLAIVAAGIAGARFSFPVADRAAASLILALVARSAYGILRNSLKSLLDASVDKATLDRMREAVRRVPDVRDPVSIDARNSGRFIFVEVKAGVSLTRLKEADETAHALERELRRCNPFVERVVVHCEPEKKAALRSAALLADRQGVLSDHFGKAPFIAIWDRRVLDGAVVSQEVLPNPYADVEKGKGLRLAEYLVALRVDVLYTRESFAGKGPEYVLGDADVDVRQTEARDLQDILEPEEQAAVP